jgi:hypothetical protein
MELQTKMKPQKAKNTRPLKHIPQSYSPVLGTRHTRHRHEVEETVHEVARCSPDDRGFDVRLAAVAAAAAAASRPPRPPPDVANGSAIFV